MLLIVINYEKQIKQPGEETAHDSASEMEIPESPHHRTRQKKCSGKNIPPTPRSGIHRERFGCQDDLFSGSHAGSTLPS
jgi:hypothetical protein